MPAPKSTADFYKLLQLTELIQKTSTTLLKEWASGSSDSNSGLASPELFEAQRTLLSAAGLLTELVSDPATRLLEVSSQYNEARALHIASDLRVPDVLAKNEKGVKIDDISSAVGIESRKLGV
jgi:hypothetical protein